MPKAPKAKRPVRPTVVVEAYYELCHEDDRANIYYKLDPVEQVRVMGELMRDVQRKIGGGSESAGAALLQRWSQPASISLAPVHGHDHLTEAIADSFLEARAAEVQALYANTATIRTSVRLPCPNCIPFGQLHISVRGTFLLVNGDLATVSAPTSLRRNIVARLGIRMRVSTAMHPLAPTDSESGGRTHGQDEDHAPNDLPTKTVKPRGSAIGHEHDHGRASGASRKAKRKPVK